MKRVIITGATGALGTALIKELINNGIESLVLCREGSLRNNNIPNSPLVTKIYCDLEKLSLLENNTGKEYDTFFHFAWSGTVNPFRNDMFLQNRNIKYALDAVNCAKRFGCKKFIGAGSQAEYGIAQSILKPNTACFPNSGYGMAKLCAGQMTRELSNQIGIEHIWVRILSIYGPNDGNQSLVMSTINKLLDGEVPKFTKGEQMWDYLYSDDAARAFRLIGEKGINGKVYVLGSGNAKPLVDYITTIRDIIKPHAKIEIGAIPYAQNQVMNLQADISDLTDDTGWMPMIEFDCGIKKIAHLHK